MADPEKYATLYCNEFLFGTKDKVSKTVHRVDLNNSENIITT